MNNTKKAIRMITLLMMGVVFTATVVNAQPGREDHPREMPDSAKIQQMVNHLDKELNLTKEQKARINALFIAHFEKEKVQREKEKPQMDKMKAAHEKTRKEFDASISAELSAEQKQKFEQFNKERQEKRGEAPKGKRKDRPRK